MNLKNVGTRIDLKGLARFQRIILIAVAVILLVINGFVFIGYLSAQNAKGELEQDITSIKAEINDLEALYDLAALLNKLDEAQRKLEEEAPFPIEVDNKEVARDVIDTARLAHITCFEYIPPSGPDVAEIGTNIYHVKCYVIQISTPETLSRMITFMELLEDLPRGTLYINSVNLAANEENWRINFDLCILFQ